MTVRKVTTCAHESTWISRAFQGDCQDPVRCVGSSSLISRIVSKPRIWSRDATFIWLENQPTLRVTGSGRTMILLLQPYYTLTFTPTHDCPVSRVRDGSSQKLRNKSHLVEPLYDGYIYLVLQTATHSGIPDPTSTSPVGTQRSAMVLTSRRNIEQISISADKWHGPRPMENAIHH